MFDWFEKDFDKNFGQADWFGNDIKIITNDIFKIFDQLSNEIDIAPEQSFSSFSNSNNPSSLRDQMLKPEYNKTDSVFQDNNDTPKIHTFSFSKSVLRDHLGNERIKVIETSGDKIKEIVTIRKPDGTVVTEDHTDFSSMHQRPIESMIKNELSHVKNDIALHEPQHPRESFFTKLFNTLVGTNPKDDPDLSYKSKILFPSSQSEYHEQPVKDSKLKSLFEKYFS